MAEKLDVYKAEQALASDVLNTAVSLLQEKYVEQWRLSSSVEERELLHLKTKLIEEVLMELKIAITNHTYP